MGDLEVEAVWRVGSQIFTNRDNAQKFASRAGLIEEISEIIRRYCNSDSDLPRTAATLIFGRYDIRRHSEK